MLAGSLVVAACSGASEEPTTEPDPSQPTASLPERGGAQSEPGTPAPPGDPSNPRAQAPPMSAGAFEGAPAYEAKLGPSTIDVSGKGNGHLSFNAGGNPAGRACLECHDGTGKGGAPRFSFAGTVYADATGKAAPRVEVRLLGADGKALSTYTDENGNFFFRASEGSFVAPAIAGIRNATTAHSMTNKINDANCNECHGDTARLVLP